MTEIGKVSTLLVLCFDCTRPIFQLYSTYVSTVLDLSFECAQHIFRFCSTYVLTFVTEIGNVLTALGLCFDFEFNGAMILCSTLFILCFDCARSMFQMRSTYVSVVLDLCFDSARPMLRLRVQQCYELVFYSARPMF